MRISKHLMLLFITVCKKQNVWKDISKHLMLLFISDLLDLQFLTIIFQNISCYCLSCNICHRVPS